MRKTLVMRADRLLRLIMLLQRHGRATAAWLAEQLEVSERTILRDMEALSAAGVPVYTERGPHGGCLLLEGFTTDASGLTSTEAQALFVRTSRESVADLGLSAQLTGALAKVSATVSSDAVQRAEALGAVLLSDRRRWFAASEQVPLLPLLREATESRRRVRLTYRTGGVPRPGVRTVDPWGLVDQSGVWYLVALHRGRERTFRVSRMVAATVLDDPAHLPDDEDLASVWARLRSGFERGRARPVTAEFLVDPSIAREFRMVVGSQMMTGTDVESVGESAGRERWRLQLRAHRAAMAQALAWAPLVELVAPPALVADVRRQAEAVARVYGPAGTIAPAGS
jgi:predicted DNA-binding transcriptional regulator YafY